MTTPPTPATPATNEEIATLERLEREATAGPWTVERDHSDTHVYALNRESLACDMQYYPWTFGVADTELIVAMRNSLGGLLSRLRAAEARAASLEAKLAEVEGAVAKRIAGELREEALGLRGVTWGKSVAEAQASVLERAADRIDPPKAEGR